MLFKNPGMCRDFFIAPEQNTKPYTKLIQHSSVTPHSLLTANSFLFEMKLSGFEKTKPAAIKVLQGLQKIAILLLEKCEIKLR